MIKKTCLILTIVILTFTWASCKSSPSDVKPAYFQNPLNNSGPDPWMTYYKGYYYLAATTWGGPELGLTMRKAKTINKLKEAKEIRIWKDPIEERSSNFWAPEFFMLDGPKGKRWYGYFTGGSPGKDFVHSQYIHVIESKGTDPLGPYTYKGKLVQRNALDASVLKLDTELYAIYSVWNTRQDIAIKKMITPWETTGKEVVISRPTLKWERQGGNVNEGPAALYHNGQTFIIFAASACWGPDYKLGMLTYNGGDPLDKNSWKKHPEPLFERSNEARVFGPGHATFFKSPDGSEDWICYHANNRFSGACDMGRTPRIQKFTWEDDGTPHFGSPLSLNEQIPIPSGE